MDFIRSNNGNTDGIILQISSTPGGRRMTDSKKCLHYIKQTGLCKFAKGNCGNRGIRKKCNCNGYPARSMRDEKISNYCYANDKLNLY